MISVLNSKLIHLNVTGGSVERFELVELVVDSAQDLPAAVGGIVTVGGAVAAHGSIAWDISTGDFYGLDGSGNWVKQ